MPHPAQLPLEALLADCNVQRTRGSGPGGQHRNKVETAIVVTHAPTSLRGEASERRSQAANRVQAVFRLRLKLAVEIRTLPATSATELWKSRRKSETIKVNPAHEDFPALLAEALDKLAAADWQFPTAAEQLGVSQSQLVKLLKQHPPAFEQANRQREALGLKRLR